MAGCPDPWTAGSTLGTTVPELDPELGVFGTCRPWVSENFGVDWQPLCTGNVELDHLGATISALAFADRNRLWVGTEEGRVFRFDREARGWHRYRLDSPETVGHEQRVTDLTPVPGQRDEVYAVFGSDGPSAPVWRFDGADWVERSGWGSSGALPLVHHTSLVAHPESGHLFAASDIGVWTSDDDGSTWKCLAAGLPDAAVTHLLLHPTGLLRAATYGRGIFEITI